MGSRSPGPYPGEELEVAYSSYHRAVYIVVWFFPHERYVVADVEQR